MRCRAIGLLLVSPYIFNLDTFKGQGGVSEKVSEAVGVGVLDVAAIAPPQTDHVREISILDKQGRKSACVAPIPVFGE